MYDFDSEMIKDGTLLAARVLLGLLFLIFGWAKLEDFSGTAAYMTQTGVPWPLLAALVAVMVEFFGGIAIIVGIWTRPLALLFALYTVASTLFAHRYWEMTGADQYANMTNFYKNVSIVGGFLLLYVTGAGKYSIHAALVNAGAVSCTDGAHENLGDKII
jgi:putative oxidoreductase